MLHSTMCMHIVLCMKSAAQPAAPDAAIDANLLRSRFTFGDAGVQLSCPRCEDGVLEGDTDTTVRCECCGDAFHVCQCGGDDDLGCSIMMHDGDAMRGGKHLMDGGEFYCAESRRMNDELDEWARDSHELAAE